MAKPIQIAGLSRRTPIARAASKALRATLLDLLEKVPEARSADSKKGIHDLRVAVKRFREAFRLFRPVLRKKTFRRHREWIEDLNDALGEVRDRDVALVQLRKLTAGLAQPPGSVADLPARLESERLVAAGALAAVRERLLDVRARWTAARRGATPESLHRARIGNKRLRYAIEPFSRMLGKEIRRLYRSASRFHDVLGDVHDADSMAVMLETAMAGAPKAERRAWERLSVKVIRGRRVALRKAFSLADELEPLWDEAQRAAEEPPH